MRQLDGFPLAIELTAARTTTLGVAAILDVLDHGGALAPIGRLERPTATPRCAAIAWSYGLLDADQQRAFRWLSAFPGGFDLDAAGPPAAMRRRRRGVGDQARRGALHKHIVVAEPGAFGMRFRLLETMRAFAARTRRPDERGAARSGDGRLGGRRRRHARRRTVQRGVEANRRDSTREPTTGARPATVAATSVTRRWPPGCAAHRPTSSCSAPGPGRRGASAPRMTVEPEDRRAVLCALVVSASGATDPAEVAGWVAEIEAIERHRPTGLGGLMRWLTLAWQRDFDEAGGGVPDRRPRRPPGAPH